MLIPLKALDKLRLMPGMLTRQVSYFFPLQCFSLWSQGLSRMEEHDNFMSMLSCLLPEPLCPYPSTCKLMTEERFKSAGTRPCGVMNFHYQSVGVVSPSVSSSHMLLIRGVCVEN